MKGLMQDWPLLVHRVLDHASTWHGEREIVSRSVEGPIHRETYRDLGRRSRALASAARQKLNVNEGHIIATMASLLGERAGVREGVKPISFAEVS